MPLLMLAMLAGCAGPTDDEKHGTSIVGTWRDSTSANMATKSHTYVFKSNGEIEVQWGREHPSVKELVDAQDDPDFVPAETGTWNIKKGTLNYEITNCNLGDHAHEPRTYEIVEITDDKLVFDAADGRQTYFRVQHD